MLIRCAHLFATCLVFWVLAVTPCACAEPKDICHSAHCDCSFCPDCLQISSEQLLLQNGSSAEKDTRGLDDNSSDFTTTTFFSDISFNFTTGFYHYTTPTKRKICSSKLERGPPTLA